MADELWILTRVLDDSDPYWNESMTIVGTPQQIGRSFDLSAGIPFGWRLLKGKKARRFLKWSLKAEARYRREQADKKNMGGPN